MGASERLNIEGIDQEIRGKFMLASESGAEGFESLKGAALLNIVNWNHHNGVTNPWIELEMEPGAD